MSRINLKVLNRTILASRYSSVVPISRDDLIKLMEDCAIAEAQRDYLHYEFISDTGETIDYSEVNKKALEELN